MKTLSRRLTQFGLAVAIGSIGAGLVCAEEKAPAKNVVISKDRIIIPGTEMSKADGQAMNKILKQFDKSLYKIEIYMNGELKKTKGTLTDVITDKELASEIAENVKKKGFTQYTVQVAGSEAGITPAGKPNGYPTVAPPPPPPSGPPGGTASNASLANPPPPPAAPPPRAEAAGSPGGGSASN